MKAQVDGELCAPCFDLLANLESPATTSNWRFHDDDPRIGGSVGSGCPFCITVYHETGNAKWHRWAITRKEEYTQVHASHDYALPHVPEHRFALFETARDVTLFALRQRALSDRSTGGDGSLLLAREWTSRCLGTHARCAHNWQPESYPTRLLDIRNDVICLVSSSDHNISGPYATLSHCWGETAVEVLTSDTLADFQAGKHIQNMPPTFQDAIKVARELDIRYLWIDCYCIIQTAGVRTEEQQLEIAKMGDIYSNAVINIGAAASTSPLEGCFVTRTSKHPVQIDFKPRGIGSANEASYVVYDVAELAQHYRDASNPLYNSMFWRAWCLQERLLSSRMLHFGRSGISWECEELGFVSDRLPVRHTPRGSWAFTSYTAPSFSLLKSPEHSLDACRKRWCQIVNMYSEMVLSFPEKVKFAACAGVAKVLEPLLGSYVLGFFRQDLILSLAWRVRRSDSPVRMANGTTLEYTFGGMIKEHMADGTKPERSPEHIHEWIPSGSETWRAPSWSWASINGNIYMDWSEASNPRAEIVNLTYELADASNPYGELKSATITIKGPMTEVQFKQTDRGDYVIPKRFYIGILPQGIEVTYDYVGESRENLNILVTESQGDNISGLVLKPVDKRRFKQPTVYRRVGAFREESDRQRVVESRVVERVITII